MADSLPTKRDKRVSASVRKHTEPMLPAVDAGRRSAVTRSVTQPKKAQNRTVTLTPPHTNQVIYAAAMSWFAHCQTAGAVSDSMRAFVLSIDSDQVFILQGAAPETDLTDNLRAALSSFAKQSPHALETIEYIGGGIGIGAAWHRTKDLILVITDSTPDDDTEAQFRWRVRLLNKADTRPTTRPEGSEHANSK